jgi:DNA-binding response OmpR family regulator
MSRVLLVEDDERIGSGLASALQANGHEVAWQRTGGSAVRAVELAPYDLVLLDLGLPDADGVDVCRAVKRLRPDCIVVMLTARTDEMDVVVGLEAGADDYLPKPFRTTELLARVRAHLRRQAPKPDLPGQLAAGDLVVDVEARRCLVAGQEVPLRSKEFDLLVCLMAAAGSALSRTRLMSEVWDENWTGSTKTLDVHVAALRQRLAAAAGSAEQAARLPEITTLRGFGYRLERDPGPSDG